MPRLCEKRSKRQKQTTPKKSLKKTNPYLKDSKIYVPALIKNVITTSAVENIHITQDKLLNKNSKISREA